MRILLAQYPLEGSAIDISHAVCTAVRPHIESPQDLLVLPEIAFGTWLENKESKGASQLDLARSVAAELHCQIILTVRVARYNRWIWLSPHGEILAQYDKLHLFHPLGEHTRYDRGASTTVHSHDMQPDARIGAAVCYDLRFGDLFAVLRQANANIIVVPARWPAVRIHHWQSLLRARAIEFQSWVVGVNAIGPDPVKPDLVYGGSSMVISPTGEIVAQMHDLPGVHIATINPLDSDNHRQDFPVWQDRVLRP